MLGVWALYHLGWRVYVLESHCLLVMPIENGTAIAERPWLNNPDSISPRLGSGYSEGYLGTQ